MEAIYYISVEYRRMPGNYNKSFVGIVNFLGPEDDEEDYNVEGEPLIHPINTSCEDSIRHEFVYKTKPARLRQLISGVEQTYFLDDDKNFTLITEHPKLMNMLSNAETDQ